jgi:hypothetical protein
MFKFAYMLLGEKHVIATYFNFILINYFPLYIVDLEKTI